MGDKKKHLDSEQLAELERRLEQERARLLELRVEDREVEEALTSDEAEDLVDRAEESRGKEETFADRQRGRIRLLAVEQALERMADGTYGLCLQCEMPIPYKRLLVVPATRYCVEHQEDAESLGLEE